MEVKKKQKTLLDGKKQKRDPIWFIYFFLYKTNDIYYVSNKPKKIEKVLVLEKTIVNHKIMIWFY